MMSSEMLPDIRPEFGEQVTQPRRGEANAEMGRDYTTGPAARWIVCIRKTRAHRRTQEIRPVECLPSRIGSDHHHATNRVTGARPNTISRAFPEIARILVKRGRYYKIAEEILTYEVGLRGAKTLHKRPPPRSITRIGMARL